MTNDAHQPSPPAAPAGINAEPVAGPACAPPRLRSEDLLRGRKELEIAHGDAVYRLRLTAMGRLILTK